MNFLSVEILIELNYTTWKELIKTMFVVNNPNFVLTEECPPVPTLDATSNVHDAYKRWTNVNLKARVHILASISDTLAKRFESMVTVLQIMQSMQEFFERVSSQFKRDRVDIDETGNVSSLFVLR
ncbi:uncharacterized protein LOC120071994 [Benincasa hispida]|uniref:uncharacterized protein LOC120071994 n=1 Tax=Benincasa hispida TaxID=102211 RepID=UPI0018FFE35D|nr:uncharacterized protein LOC120071994 [Benincasa hispida]